MMPVRGPIDIIAQADSYFGCKSNKQEHIAPFRHFNIFLLSLSLETV